jgi:hypothetical protein
MIFHYDVGGGRMKNRLIGLLGGIVMISGCATIGDDEIRTSSWNPTPPEDLIGRTLVLADSSDTRIALNTDGSLLFIRGEERYEGSWSYEDVPEDIPYLLRWGDGQTQREYVASIKSRSGLYTIRGYFHHGDTLIRFFGEYRLADR